MAVAAGILLMAIRSTPWAGEAPTTPLQTWSVCPRVRWEVGGEKVVRGQRRHGEMMDTADLLLTIWALIGALAGAVIYRVFKRRGCLDAVIDGALGGAVAGTLVYKLHLGLPFYSGTLVSALVGAIAVVIMLDRYRAT